MPLLKKWQLDKHEDDSDIHHREWGWADEQGWLKSIILPLTEQNGWTRYANNPILQKGASGAWDDKYVEHPCVIRLNGIYYMFYAGRKVSDEIEKIGLAQSTDPYGQSPVFSKHASNPIISPTGTEDRAMMPSVIYDHHETDLNKKWKAWICHHETAPAGYSTKFYTAPNPEGTWTLQGACTGLTAYQYCNSVMRLGLMYFMLYVDTDFNVRSAISSDGLAWNSYGVVLSHGGAGEWDDLADAYLSVFWNLGVWYIIYGGAPVGVAHFQIGMATNTDGWSTFTKFFRNPVYSYGGAGAWDEKHVNFPSLLMFEDKFLMYYSGCNNSNVYAIGLATIP